MAISSTLRFLFLLSLSLSSTVSLFASPLLDSNCKKALTKHLVGAEFLAQRQVIRSDDPRVESIVEDFEAQNNTSLEGATERIAAWLRHLERVINSSSNNNGELEKVRKHFHDLYVVKFEDIPDSYYEGQLNLAREQGHETALLSDAIRKELAEILISDQRASLNRWLNYFLDSETSDIYPVWIKYWTLVELGKLGKFNASQGTFSGRPKGTVAPFAELNREAYALVVDLVVKHLNKESLPEIADPLLLRLLKRKKFSSMYGRALQITALNEADMDSVEGEWVTYKQGTDHTPLYQSLQGRATGWCTAGEETAQSQLRAGDFHVYYTKVQSGEVIQPRIAIRMEGKSIVEVRGVGEDQNLDDRIAQTTILDRKLKEFGVEGERYRKRSSDVQKLAMIYEKQKTQEVLSLEELRFLYEIDSPIEGFGHGEHPRVAEIISQRDKKADFVLIYNLDPNLVTDKKEDILNGKAHYFVGDYTHEDGDDLSRAHLVAIFGYANFGTLRSSTGLSALSFVRGNANFWSLSDASGLTTLEYIEGYADFKSLKDASGLTALAYIGDYAKFWSLTDARGLSALTSIGGYAEFMALKNARGLSALTSIGGYVDFRSLKDASGLSALDRVEGSANFESLTDARGLSALTHIGGNANFYHLTNAGGLTSLAYIGGRASFSSLEDATGLSALAYIGDYAHFKLLKDSSGLSALVHIGNFSHFPQLVDQQWVQEEPMKGRFVPR